MKISRRYALIALVAASACLTLVGTQARAASLTGTSAEQAAMQSAEIGKWTRAREQAEAVLDENPRSIIGNYVLADVMHEWEANLPRALFLARVAKRLLLAEYGDPPSDAQAQIWHKKILLKENYLLGELDDKEAQLHVLDEYDAHYAPKQTRLRIWPLMKLNRFEEARRAGEELARSTDYWERVSAYNGLMALEDERLDRRASYDWGIKGIEATQGQSCILLHNSSQAALTLFQYKEAEELARRALRASRNDCPNSSYEHLANLYLLQAEFNKTVSAFKKLSRAPIDRRYVVQFHQNNRAILVELLYALGKIDEGLEFARQVYAAPDRTGMTSVSVEDVEFARGALYWMMLDLRIQQLEDERSVRGALDNFDRTWRIRELRLERWEMGRILTRLAIHDDILVTNLRPYLRGLKPWYAGAMIRVFGGGVFRAAVAAARALDGQITDEAHGTFQAYLGEASYVDEDWEDAIRLGEDALKTLAAEQVLLRYRVMTYVAASKLALGRDTAGATNQLREVLRKVPSALRHLDVQIPVQVFVNGGGFVDDVADGIDDSRRFRTGVAGGFRVDVRMTDADVQVCLAASDGFQLACSETEVDKLDSDDVATVVDAFVAAVLAPKIELTTSDINSLDGSTVRVDADQVLDGILPTKKSDEDEED